jgi:hypothetical protein
MAGACGAVAGHGVGVQSVHPMLLVYRHDLGLGTGTLEAVFGMYALA